MINNKNAKMGKEVKKFVNTCPSNEQPIMMRCIAHTEACLSITFLFELCYRAISGLQGTDDDGFCL